jgi:hypothetical protein
MNKLITNYFAAEQAIIGRLRERVEGIAKIYTPFDLHGVVESSQASPALHVVYAGDSVGGTQQGQQSGAGASKTVDQRWLVVLAVRTAAAQLQDTTEIRVKAGEFIPQILDALQGWQPVEWMRPLARVSGPAAGYSSSFAYFPFLFEGRVLT